MVKQIIAIILLSIAIIFSMPYIQQGLQLLLSMHDWIADVLTQVFSVGEAGDLIRQLIALLAVPVVIGLIPAFIYWLVKRSWFPYFMEFLWVAWIVQASALAIVYQTPPV